MKIKDTLAPPSCARAAALLACLALLQCGDDEPDPPRCEQQPDTSGGKLYAVSTFADVGGKSEDIAFDGKGNLYVSMTRDGQIKKVTSGGKVSLVASGLAAPAGIAMAPGGDLYVCEYGTSSGGGKLSRVTPAGVKSTVATAAGSTTFKNPNHVAVSSAGVVYMSDSGGFVARIQGTTATMLLDAKAKVKSASPNGLALSSDERTLYVNDLFANKNLWVVSLDADGKATKAEAMTLDRALPLADGIALDCRGHLYITYGLSKVAVVDPVAKTAKDIYTGQDLSTPANVAFGRGSGFDPRSLYIAQLGMTGSPTTVAKMYVGVTGK